MRLTQATGGFFLLLAVACPQVGCLSAAETPGPAVVEERVDPPAQPAAPAPTSPAAKPAIPSGPKAAPAPATAAKGKAAAKPAPAPALDLALLEKRLKDTPAIGVFTKLTLKNQVDDLLNEFRAFYQHPREASLGDLRQSYDLLILKVLTLLQDGDPPLAREIRDSREAIWRILSDRSEFSKLQAGTS